VILPLLNEALGAPVQLRRVRIHRSEPGRSLHDLRTRGVLESPRVSVRLLGADESVVLRSVEKVERSCVVRSGAETRASAASVF
jgi:hypothetical protein